MAEDTDPNSVDPIITSYDVYLTDSQTQRLVLQYVNRPKDRLPEYTAANGQQPTAFRLKPQTGIVEVDVPIDEENYDTRKGRKYGEALKQSRSTAGFGMAGGFGPGATGTGVGGGRVKIEAEDVEMLDAALHENADSTLRIETLGGRIKAPEEGDPLYMLGAIRGTNLYLSPVSAVVQLRPQLHHVDAIEELSKGRAAKAKKDLDDDAPPQTEARVIDVKVKSAEGDEDFEQGNNRLLKNIHLEPWKHYEWMDPETEEAWQAYESHMIHNYPEELPQLVSAIQGEDYLDEMSAPRIDPAHPEMTGWAMKQNRKKEKSFSIDVDQG